MKFKEFVLVAVLVLAGLVLFQFKTGRWSLDDLEWGDESWFAGQEAAAEETRTIEAPVPAVLEIENGHGWVDVRGADQDNVQLTFKKTVWRRKEADARAVLDQIKYSLTATAEALVLRTNREEFRRRNFETGFILTVPRGTVVRVVNGYGAVRVDGVRETRVRNRHGEVLASNVAGACDLETSYEDAEVREIAGACRVVNSHADVRAGAVKGDLTVRTSYARIRVDDAGGLADLGGTNTDVEANRVAGAVTVDTSYEKVTLRDVGPAKVTGHNMAVTAEGVRGDLEVQTSYEPVRVAGVEGRLTVEAHNASVQATGVGGPVLTVRTSYENVTLADFSAETSVVCRQGAVSLAPRDMKRGLDVRNENGPIELVWPSGQKARVEARSKGGSVNWGLADRPDVDETNGVALIKAYGGEAGAPLVYLSTTYDSIRIIEGSRKF
jgi:DUF4097 and DUF4098 domain-containing protein YvlB